MTKPFILSRLTHNILKDDILLSSFIVIIYKYS
nr:MAG TPA: hypothetical protein [Caudoviricetes sp.]